MTLPWIKTPRGKTSSKDCSSASLGPLDALIGARIGLSFRSVGPDTVRSVGGGWIQAEPSLAVGLELRGYGDAPHARHHLERGVRNPLARVGIGHAAGKHLCWHQRRGHRLRGRDVIRLDRNCLEGEPRVVDGEHGREVAAQPAQGVAAVGVGRHRPGPRRHVNNFCRRQPDSVEAAGKPGRLVRAKLADRRDRERDVGDGPALQVKHVAHGSVARAAA